MIQRRHCLPGLKEILIANGKYETTIPGIHFVPSFNGFHWSKAVIESLDLSRHSLCSPLKKQMFSDDRLFFNFQPMLFKLCIRFLLFRPSPEEAKKWQTSFESMLKHRFGVQLFQDFLRSQYGEENLNFWLAVEEYKKVDEESRTEKARMIYEDFVSTLSPTEVSVIFSHESQF